MSHAVRKSWSVLPRPKRLWTRYRRRQCFNMRSGGPDLRNITKARRAMLTKVGRIAIRDSTQQFSNSPSLQEVRSINSHLSMLQNKHSKIRWAGVSPTRGSTVRRLVDRLHRSQFGGGVGLSSGDEYDVSSIGALAFLAGSTRSSTHGAMIYARMRLLTRISEPFRSGTSSRQKLFYFGG